MLQVTKFSFGADAEILMINPPENTIGFNLGGSRSITTLNNHIYIGTSVTFDHEFGTLEESQIVMVNCPAIIKINYFTLDIVYT